MPRRTDDNRTTALALRDDARAARGGQVARARELLAHIKRNTVLITDAFYEVGEALAELHNNRLHLALGYRSFADLLEDNALMSLPQATKLIAVATHVPREAAVRLGAEKSFELTRYARFAALPTGVRGLLEAGEVEGRPLQELTVREVAALAREARGPVGRQPSVRRRGAMDKLARQTQATLQKRGLGGLKVTALVRGGQPRFRLELDEEAVRLLLKRM